MIDFARYRPMADYIDRSFPTLSIYLIYNYNICVCVYIYIQYKQTCTLPATDDRRFAQISQQVQYHLYTLSSRFAVTAYRYNLTINRQNPSKIYSFVKRLNKVRHLNADETTVNLLLYSASRFCYISVDILSIKFAANIFKICSRQI